MTTKNTADAEQAPKRVRSRAKLRRRLSGLLALAVALIGAGALYALVVPTPQTAHAADSQAITKGQQLYETTCITCHGANLQGVKDRGPSLIGVGSAAVYFQVSTGRMPLDGQSAQAVSKPTEFTPEQIDELGAYIQAHGGGPQRPAATGDKLVGDDPARGGQLFRLNCAQCHNFTGQGGALSGGKFAPSLQDTSPDVLYTAMLTGPQNMPKFSDRQLTPQEKEDIIAYVRSVQGQNNPGGDALGGLGPVSEGFIAWVVGIAALVGVTLWIGARA